MTKIKSIKEKYAKWYRSSIENEKTEYSSQISMLMYTLWSALFSILGEVEMELEHKNVIMDDPKRKQTL